MPAEKALRDSNWLTIKDRSPRMWLKAPYDWLTWSINKVAIVEAKAGHLGVIELQ